MNKLWLLCVRIVLAGLLVTLSLPACSLFDGQASVSPLPASSPEEQGMDSQVLLKIPEHIVNGKVNIHSFLVLRNGKIVLETYYPPFAAQDKHILLDATKSFISALIGIAIGEGKIQSVDQPVLDFFPDTPIEKPDENKKDIHIHDLLNMTSGLYADDMKMGESPDWSAFTLNQPVVYKLGTEFIYNSGNSHLLSAIIQKTTGKTAAEYAQEKLFAPLGIADYYWAADPSGVTQGGDGLMLAPRDMARFGLLYLSQGQWEGKQIVPEEWVAASIDGGTEYTYQWWQFEQAFAALGNGGQWIQILPSEELVVVVTAGLPLNDFPVLEYLVDEYVLKAIQSDQALPETPETQPWAEQVQAITAQKAKEVPKPPDIAASVDGKTFNLEANSMGWKTVRLEFDGDQAWLSITTTANPGPQRFAIGLDGQYRMTKLKKMDSPSIDDLEVRTFLNPYECAFLVGMPVDGSVGMLGEWSNTQAGMKFVLTIQDTRDFDQERLMFSFSPPDGRIDWNSELEGILLSLKMAEAAE